MTESEKNALKRIAELRAEVDKAKAEAEEWKQKWRKLMEAYNALKQRHGFVRSQMERMQRSRRHEG